MSYHSWTVNGYGFEVSDIADITLEKMRKVCENAPETQKAMLKEIRECFGMEGIPDKDLVLDRTEVDDFFFYLEPSDPCVLTNFALYLRNAINEAEDVETMIATGYSGGEYLLLGPYYSWSKVSEKEKNLTQDDAESMFRKYLDILTDEDIVIDYFSVENGG